MPKDVAEPIKQEPLSVDSDGEIPLHFNLGGPSDAQLAFYHESIQKSVESAWSPPIGVRRGTECVAMFTLDSSGEIIAFDIAQSSGILVYDLSVARAAENIAFDSCLWGKTFQINFRQ